MGGPYFQKRVGGTLIESELMDSNELNSDLLTLYGSRRSTKKNTTGIDTARMAKNLHSFSASLITG